MPPSSGTSKVNQTTRCDIAEAIYLHSDRTALRAYPDLQAARFISTGFAN
jgi:hypothetical protein